MADEIATGYASSGSTGGPGAVIFGGTEDPFKVVQSNLNGLDKWVTDQQAENQKLLRRSTAMLGAFNPKLDGIFPADATTITDATSALNQKMINQLQNGKPSFQADVDLQNDRMKINSVIEGSQMKQKYGYAAIQYMQKDGGKKVDLAESQKNLGHFLMTPPNQLKPDQFTNLIVPKPEDLDLLINKSIKQDWPTPTETKTATERPKGASPYEMYSHDIKENIPADKIPVLATSLRQMPATSKVVDEAWQTEQKNNPDAVKALVDKYTTQGINGAQAMDKAQQDWLTGRIMSMHYVKDEQWNKQGLSFAGQLALEQAKKADTQATKADYGYAHIISDVWNGRPNADNAIINFKMKPYEVTNPDGTLKVDDNGKAIMAPDKILKVGANPDGTRYVVTQQSSQWAKGNAAVGQDPNQIFIKSKINFPNPQSLAVFLGNNSDEKDYSLQGTDIAFTQAKAITSTGDWDTRSFAPPEKWQTQPTGSNKPAVVVPGSNKTNTPNPDDLRKKYNY